MSEIYSIYILHSESADKYYVGYSRDVQARLQDHNEGERPQQSTKYTFKHRPWRLVCSFEVGSSRGEAMKVEKYIKRQKSRRFLEKIIDIHKDLGGLAQLVRVPARRD